ncbi:MAG: hypothetical protein QOF39_2811 [Frankiales bacterium]|jgi:hypothetical protein|nr:hypothetical protein [Frankiales bacterium]
MFSRPRGQVKRVTDAPQPAATVAKRSPWWLELVLIAGVYWVYSWVADQAPREDPLQHARSILSLERTLHVNIEYTLNHAWTSHGRDLIVFGNLYYDLMHFIVPVGALLWVYFFRHETYRRLRTPLLLVSIAALAVFWLWPTAPPRLLPELGIYDTIARVHTLGGGGSHGMTAAENPFGALPSLHIAWATWAAYAVWSGTRQVLWRALLVANVLVMSFMVMATGNHWVTDVVAGAAGVGLSVLISYGAAWAWDRRSSPPAVSATDPVPASIDDARR